MPSKASSAFTRIELPVGDTDDVSDSIVNGICRRTKKIPVSFGDIDGAEAGERAVVSNLPPSPKGTLPFVNKVSSLKSAHSVYSSQKSARRVSFGATKLDYYVVMGDHEDGSDWELVQAM
mmetsp:Transcript_8234/g.18409  ORF Transcript_8234/g.18409 Transcript_8234/m.18409 type:complete len:120 (+) Transcript_8234:145-504(+)|eukprot:CAMPEP_0178395362 /NCGR_PEP_ID=MMETSP0689_2-20121128/13179_1 /TAXON_ID=160604 /ORGANISM="Amphidinium massartii, Strain CS-259" /LENGTH=119 /DNA_ID=CAMNT_0020016013 /DNA_START=60 /DNA_END=419 /DNA_ORIENTATION=-